MVARVIDRLERWTRPHIAVQVPRQAGADGGFASAYNVTRRLHPSRSSLPPASPDEAEFR